MPTRAAGSFERLLAGFLRERRRKGYARATESEATRYLRRLWAHVRSLGRNDVRQVVEADIVSFARWMQTTPSERGTPFSVASLSQALEFARGFFASLERRGVILESPARSVYIPRSYPLPRVKLTPESAARLLGQPAERTAIGKRDRAVLEILYLTGLRASECCRLELSDVSFTDGTLLIRNGKGRKDRMVPLVGRAAAALDLYLREGRPKLVKNPHERRLFIGWRKEPLPLGGLEQMVGRHAKSAGLGAIHPHALRHACAAHLLKGGASVRHVQELLGHASVNTTMRYTRVEISDLARVVHRSHPRERWRRRALRGTMTP